VIVGSIPMIAGFDLWWKIVLDLKLHGASRDCVCA